MQLLPLEEETQSLHVCWLGFLKTRLAVSIENFARVQAGFLSSGDFHHFSRTFIDGHGLLDFYIFAWIS